MADKDVKFTEDEMKQIQGIQKEYVDVQRELGQLSISRLRLETQVDSLDNREDELKNTFKSLQESERTFIKQLVQKYVSDGSDENLFNEEEVGEESEAEYTS